MVDPIPMVHPIPRVDLIPMVDPIPMVDIIPMVDPIPLWTPYPRAPMCHCLRHLFIEPYILVLFYKRKWIYRPLAKAMANGIFWGPS